MDDIVKIHKLRAGFLITTLTETLAAFSSLDEALEFVRSYIQGEASKASPDAPADDERLIDLQLSYRTLRRLTEAGIETVRDVRKKSVAELLRIEGFGRKSLNELKGNGIAIGTLPSDDA